MHWIGATWDTLADTMGPYVYGLWGSSANDVWAVGQFGLIEHWDGSGWSTVPSGKSENLKAVWGSSANDVWAVGDVVFHWSGK